MRPKIMCILSAFNETYIGLPQDYIQVISLFLFYLEMYSFHENKIYK